MQNVNEEVRILVIGDFIRDIDIHGTCSRFAAEAPGCPIFAEERCEQRPGGAGAVAIMAECLGANARIVSAPHESVKTRLFAHGRQVWRHDQDATRPSATDVKRMVEKVEEYMVFAQAVLIADYGKGACQHAVVRAAIDGAAKGIPCLVDPAHGVDWRTYCGATVIKCNRAEWLRAGSDKHSSVVVITDGEKGLSYFGSPRPAQYPARPSRLVDVTGAGDMVLAALGICLARGMDWPEACRFANVAAGLKVERHGAVAVPVAKILEELEAEEPLGVVRGAR